VLFLTLHHIVSDGWSTGIFVRELGALYRAASCRGPSPLPELPIQYADFAVWQRRRLSGEVLAEELRAAVGRLAGLAPLALPVDRPAAATGRLFRAGTVHLALAAPLAAGLQALARPQGAR